MVVDIIFSVTSQAANALPITKVPNGVIFPTELLQEPYTVDSSLVPYCPYLTLTSMISLICKWNISSLFKIPGGILKSLTVKLKYLNWNYIPGSSSSVHYLSLDASLSLSHSLVVLSPCKLPYLQMILQQCIPCFFLKSSLNTSFSGKINTEIWKQVSNITSSSPYLVN